MADRVLVENLGTGNRVEAADGAVMRAARIAGDRNTIIIGRGAGFVQDARVRIEGNDNIIEIGERTKLTKDSFIRIMGSSNRVSFGARCNGHIRLHVPSSGSTFEMGEDSTVIGMRCAMHETARMIIGRDCMFAAEIWISASDMHSLIDLESGRRINPAADVVIGDHVWLCVRVCILKGTTVGSGSTIAAGAIVTGAIPENCVAAGVPARVIRRGVTWERKLLRKGGRPLALDGNTNFEL
jgi:acetyltransferase-like isoleucine patch superfamily enzyme